MKNKYQRMTKEEKLACQKKYYETTKGKEMKIRFLRLKIIGTIGILFSIFLIASGYISGEISWSTWVISIILCVFSTIYISGAIILKRKCLNQYAVKKMK